MKTIKIFKGWWTLNDIKNNRDHLFIFGDNDIGRGKGGQAIIRDEPNAFGIPTKKYPSNAKNSFYTDEEYKTNKIKIRDALHSILKEFMSNDKYTTLTLPEDGLGTGLAQLPIKAPKTYKFLENRLKALKILFN